MSEKNIDEKKSLGFFRFFGVVFLPTFFCWGISRKKGYSTLAVVLTYSWTALYSVSYISNKYYKKVILNGPYASQVKSYQDYKSSVVLNRNKMKEVRIPPKDIEGANQKDRELKKICKSLPIPDYKFQDSIFSSQLSWCTAMFEYKSNIYNAVEQTIPEVQIQAMMEKHYDEMTRYENFMIDGMSDWPDEFELVAKLEKNQLLPSKINNTNAISQEDKQKIKLFLKGHSHVFNVMMRAIKEKDPTMWKRIVDQHTHSCNEKPIFQSKDLNEAVENYCNSSQQGIRAIASVDGNNIASIAPSIYELEKRTLASLKSIKKIVDSSER